MPAVRWFRRRLKAVEPSFTFPCTPDFSFPVTNAPEIRYRFPEVSFHANPFVPHRIKRLNTTLFLRPY